MYGGPYLYTGGCFLVHVVYIITMYITCVCFFVNRYGVAHADFSPDPYTVDYYGLGRMECIGDEPSLLVCPNASFGPFGFGECSDPHDMDVGIVCSNTCEDLDWRLP